MKVAIIGAGASGLTAIKSCLDEGLRPVCFDKQDDIGGIWRYVEGEKDGATVYKSTVINTSKEMMCFSDFPIPKEFPNFLPNVKVQEYFKLYAEKFDLMKYIAFHTEVVSCTPSDGFASNGQWKVVTKNTKTEETKSEYYDGVLVCVGHHAIPYYPLDAFPGIDKFKGKYSHSHNYRHHKGYEDLRVLVIGIGNSGGDIAVELSRQCKQIYLSTRRGSWILKRIDENGLPIDHMMTRKFIMDTRKLLPDSFVEFLAQKRIDSRVNHEKYCLKPKHGVFSQHPMANDDMPNRIMAGSIVMKANVVRFTETTAVFEDGTEEEVDAVIFATGYSISYPFLNSDVIKVNENDADLYKFVYPISLPRHTLAVIGCIQPIGAVNPISEIQCRWATRVIKREAFLPSVEDMKKDISGKKEAMRRRYVQTRRHTVQVDYIDYMDEIAEQVHCKPNVLKLFLTDPALAMKVYFGPAVPYIYRLQGPGKWPMARKAIMTVEERMTHPLKTRKVDAVEPKGGVMKMMIFIALVAVFIMWCLSRF